MRLGDGQRDASNILPSFCERGSVLERCCLGAGEIETVRCDRSNLTPGRENELLKKKKDMH